MKHNGHKPDQHAKHSPADDENLAQASKTAENNENANNDELVNFSELKNAQENKEQNIDQKQDQVTELKTKLIQAQADFENIKKRLEKDKITAVNFANESFARDLLPVLDTLEMAINAAGDDEASAKIKEGISLTIDSFKKVLSKHGVRMIQTNEGGEFNPQVHNAMSYIESDTIASGRIAQIYQHGYMYNDRILRPAMVLISK